MKLKKEYFKCRSGITVDYYLSTEMDTSADSLPNQNLKDIEAMYLLKNCLK